MKRLALRIRRGMEEGGPRASAKLRGVIFLIGVGVCLTGRVSPGMALALGIVPALGMENPWRRMGQRVAKVLLQVCVVLLGFGMDLHVVMRAGREGFVMAAGMIAGTFALGWLLARALKVRRVTSALISAGTAICGGSAIAAVGSILGAEEGDMSVAMGTVFLLNAVALFVFPLVGHALGMTPTQFGVWAGVSIHDISSVVGAATEYGGGAIETATAVKLSRAIWIVPVALGVAWAFGRGISRVGSGSRQDFEPEPLGEGGGERGALQVPWFIGVFLLASVVRTFVPAAAGSVATWGPIVAGVARVGLTVTLFLIGAGLSKKALRAVGVGPMVQGVILWVAGSVVALGVVLWTVK